MDFSVGLLCGLIAGLVIGHWVGEAMQQRTMDRIAAQWRVKVNELEAHRDRLLARIEATRDALDN
jgi:hypothetical protein